ncbi:hypothetical protein SRA_05586 [Streptococcus ratti FA-1 = DSM 20564]|uniref:Uncharacterized protein n=1 Tax=Streptococcus ratti FA-1 = DSM 20564 TaxID=699248 RepID=A0ABN0GUG7_STRRT|nr:hypothetical protein SRA_05586 [Streptococcus ratti FA-1 = DSM 20564]
MRPAIAKTAEIRMGTAKFFSRMPIKTCMVTVVMVASL